MICAPRIHRVVWLILGIFVVGYVVFLLRGAIFPFIVGGTLAYILHPLVVSIEQLFPFRDRRPNLSRFVSIGIVFAIILALVATALTLVIPKALEQFDFFLKELPDLFGIARITVERWGQVFTDKVPEAIRLQAEDALNNAGNILVGAGQNVIIGTFSAVSSALTIVIGLAVVPLFLYYMLKDAASMVEGVASFFPENQRHHVINVISVVNHSFSSYVRAQLFLGLVVGVLVFVGLTILDVRFAIVLGIVAGVFELIPIIGPWLGAIPGIIVVLATSPEDFVWVVLLYLGIQLLENSLLVPRIQSKALHVHPVMIMVVLVLGSELAGLWGVVLGPPLVAAAKEVFMYFRDYWAHELPFQQALREEQERSSSGQEIPLMEQVPSSDS